MKLPHRAVAVVAFTMVCPAVAHAGELPRVEPTGLIEQMSGPGPFKVIGLMLPVACAKDFSGRTPKQTYRRDRYPDCSYSDVSLRALAEIRASYLTSGDRPRFSDTPSDTRTVKGLRVDAVVSVRLNPVLDVGAGVGFIRFWGEGFSAKSRPTITPVIVQFTPLALGLPPDVAGSSWRRLVSVQYEALYIPKGFTGRDFGSTATSYSTGAEYLSTLNLVVDLNPVFGR